MGRWFAGHCRRVECGSACWGHLHCPSGAQPLRQHGRMGQSAGRHRIRLAGILPHPEDLSHALPPATLRDDAVDGPGRGNRSQGVETLTAALGLKGVSAGQRWTAPAGVPAMSGVCGARQPKSVQRCRAARQAGAGHRCPWRLQLRRPEHGHADSTSTASRRLGPSPGRRRSGSVDSRTLSGAGGDGRESRITIRTNDLALARG